MRSTSSPLFLSFCLIAIVMLFLVLTPYRTALPNQITVRAPLLYSLIQPLLSVRDALQIAQDRILQGNLPPGHITAMRYYPIFGAFRNTKSGSGAYWMMSYKFDRNADPMDTTVLVYTSGKAFLFPAR